jgi:outer membrane immunogenic protein
MKTNLSIRILALFFLALPGGWIAGAQGTPPAVAEHRVGLELMYDYVHTNGPPGGCGCFHLNGGGGAVVVPIKSSPFSILGRVDGTHGGGIGSASSDLTLITYAAGLRYALPMRRGILRPYGEFAVGGAHSGGSLAGGSSTTGKLGSAFAGSVGGGLNLQLRPMFAIKLFEAEYLATTFANGVNDHQNNLRLSAGVAFTFCSFKGCKHPG